MLKNFLLHYGESSKSLREEMAKWTELLANTQPNRATYRAAIAGRLVAFNKFPGVRPLCISESWRRLWAKLVIKNQLTKQNKHVEQMNFVEV